MDNEKGFITLSGTLNHGDKKPMTISKILPFSPDEYQGVVTATSSSVVTLI